MTARNVWIIDKAFYMPQLHRWRRVWIYLPEDYASSGRSYPVLYMHDGQNLFEDWSAFGEEWGVDETLNSMPEKIIVVGIDNGGVHRLQEYNYLDHPEHGKGEGKHYLQFISETLKPYIDTTYRTHKGREHTAIAGSSMGGLISFYAGLYFPQIFGAIGVFSPSFWLSPHFFEETLLKLPLTYFSDRRFYFYAGEKEEQNLAAQTREIATLVSGRGGHVTEVYHPKGLHNEAFWREQFPQFYKWLLNIKTF